MIGVLIFAIFCSLNFKTVKVSGESMEPTFENGRTLLMSRAYWLVGPIQRNDIVVVKTIETQETLIKRVKGLPGDVIDFMDIPRNWRLTKGEYRVPTGSYYCLGDNRPVSQDSRDLGPFDKSQVLGKIVVYGNEAWLMAFGSLAAFAFIGTMSSSVITKMRARGQAI